MTWAVEVVSAWETIIFWVTEQFEEPIKSIDKALQIEHIMTVTPFSSLPTSESFRKGYIFKILSMEQFFHVP